MDFLLDARSREASTHLESGICDRSMTVPTVTENGWRQSLQL